MVYTINKVIYGSFNKETASFQFQLDVRGIVKSFTVKQVSYCDDTNLVELVSFGILYSDLSQNNPLSIVSMGSTSNAVATTGTSHVASPTNNIVYRYDNPIKVSGLYTFSLKDLYGNIFPFSAIAGTINMLIAIVIEFECEYNV